MATGARHRRPLRLGTRGSQLARWQADWVAAELRALGHVVDLVVIVTHGDLDRTRSIEEIGTRGAFTKAIQQALVANEIDLAVHSLKDLPTTPTEGLVLAAVPKRGSPADALLLAAGLRPFGRTHPQVEEKHDVQQFVMNELLPRDARVGTGSLRRQAQLLHARPDLRVEDVRGNVDTRLRKLDEGRFDALVLAEAGLRRLGLVDRIDHVLSFDIMLPSAGQGALGIECRADDRATRAAVGPLDDSGTNAAATAERSLLEHLRGGCMAPVGALGVVEADVLRLQAVVLSPDGSKRLAAQDIAKPRDAAVLGQRLAETLVAQGAAELIAGSRASK